RRAVLRALRESRGITQPGWAAWLGYSVATVRRWESGTAGPTAEAEDALVAYCAQKGLFRTFDDGRSPSFTLTPELLRDLLAEARLQVGQRQATSGTQDVSSGAKPPTSLAAMTPAPTRAAPMPMALTRFVGREPQIAEVR